MSHSHTSRDTRHEKRMCANFLTCSFAAEAPSRAVPDALAFSGDQPAMPRHSPVDERAPGVCFCCVAKVKTSAASAAGRAPGTPNSAANRWRVQVRAFFKGDAPSPRERGGGGGIATTAATHDDDDDDDELEEDDDDDDDELEEEEDDDDELDEEEEPPDAPPLLPPVSALRARACAAFIALPAVAWKQ